MGMRHLTVLMALIYLTGCAGSQVEELEEALPTARDLPLPNGTLEPGVAFVVGDYEVVFQETIKAEKTWVEGKVYMAADGYSLYVVPYRVTRITKGEMGYPGLEFGCAGGEHRYLALGGLKISPEAAFPLGWQREDFVLP